MNFHYAVHYRWNPLQASHYGFTTFTVVSDKSRGKTWNKSKQVCPFETVFLSVQSFECFFCISFSLHGGPTLQSLHFSRWILHHFCKWPLTFRLKHKITQRYWGWPWKDGGASLIFPSNYPGRHHREGGRPLLLNWKALDGGQPWRCVERWVQNTLKQQSAFCGLLVLHKVYPVF